MRRLGAAVQTFRLFRHHILCLFVSPQTEKNRLTKLVVERPLRKLELGNQNRLDPLAALHDCRGMQSGQKNYSRVRHKSWLSLQTIDRISIC
jgi:hypothetical protein